MNSNNSYSTSPWGPFCASLARGLSMLRQAMILGLKTLAVTSPALNLQEVTAHAAAQYDTVGFRKFMS